MSNNTKAQRRILGLAALLLIVGIVLGYGVASLTATKARPCEPFLQG